MAKIIDLPPLATIDGSEIVIIEKDGVTWRGTLRETLEKGGLAAEFVKSGAGSVADALEGKASKAVATGLANGLMSAADKDALDALPDAVALKMDKATSLAASGLATVNRSKFDGPVSIDVRAADSDEAINGEADDVVMTPKTLDGVLTLIRQILSDSDAPMRVTPDGRVIIGSAFRTNSGHALITGFHDGTVLFKPSREVVDDIAIPVHAETDAPFQVIGGRAVLWSAARDLLGRMPVVVWNDGTTALKPDPTPPPGMPYVMRLKARPAAIADGVMQINHILSYGQSNSRNWLSGPGVDLEPLNPGRALMHDGGWTLTSGEYPGQFAYDNAVGPLVDLVDSADCISAARMASRLLAGFPTDQAIMCSAAGVAGQNYSFLKSGTQPWANMARSMRRAAFFAQMEGIAYRVALMNWTQGENDVEDTEALYLADLIEGQADFERVAIEIDGMVEPKPWIITQPSSWTASGLSRTGVVTAIVRATLENRLHFDVAGAMYMHPFLPDGIHHSGVGARRSQQDRGRANQARMMHGSFTALGLGATAARVGTTVTVTFPKPVNPAAGWVAPLVIDTARVTDPGNLGISYVDAGENPIAVSNVELVPGQDNQLRFTIASAVAGTVCIGTRFPHLVGAHAGPNSGPRICLRDSLIETYADGSPASNWAIHCETPCN